MIGRMLRAIALAMLPAVALSAAASAENCPRPPAQWSKPMQFYTEKGQYGTDIIALGAIQGGEARRLARLIDRVGAVNEIKLASPGGNMNEGIRLGHLIRERKLATRVPRGWMCASACTHAFLGGVLRKVDPGGCFIVHMASASAGLGPKIDGYYKKLQRTNMSQAQYNKTVQEMIQVIEQLAAQAAEIQANYFLQMAVSLKILDAISDTPHSKGRTLTQAELQLFNVNNY